MDGSNLISIRSLLGTFLSLALLNCGGGGGEGGTPFITTPAQTIVSGSVQAPAGQIAFFRESSIGNLFVSDAYAALTGLTNVSDNTIVELARLDSTATNVTVLSTTTTSGGRYSFNLTNQGLQPAQDLIVRVAGPGGKELRAFVVGTVIDLSPVSEATYRLAIQSLGGGPLSNLTLQEVSDIGGAVGLIATLQNIGNATAVDQGVALVRTAVDANTQVSAFIAAAGETGQTTHGTGDVGNYFPLSQGNNWNYQGKTSEPGVPTEHYANTVNVNGTLVVGGSLATILTSSDSGGSHSSQDDYVVKDASSVRYVGNNDRDDSIAPATVPYTGLHFPLHVNNKFQQVNKNGLSLDVNGDGIKEIVNLSSTVSVIGFENIVVPAGSFANTAKMTTEVTITVNGVSVTGAETLWLAPGVGVDKNQTTATSHGVTLTTVEELTSYQVDGTVQGALPGVIVNTGPTFSIESVPGKAAIASNGTDFLITACTTSGSHPGIFGIFITSLGKIGSQIPLVTGDCYQETVAKPAVAFGGSNYLLVYHQTLPFGVNRLIRGNRLSAEAVVLDGADGFLVSEDTIADRCCAAVGFDGTNYLVTWSERGASDIKIYGARIAPNGQNLGVFPITSAIPGQQFRPKVAFDGTNYLVIWSEANTVATGEDISGARVAPTGTVLDPGGFRIATTALHERNPEIAFDGSNYLVVWESVEPLGGNFVNYHIRGTRISKAGALLDGPASEGGIPINMTTHEKRTPSVTFDGSQFLVVWTVGQNSFAPWGSIVGTKVGANGQVTPLQPNPGGFLFSHHPPSSTRHFFPSIFSRGGKTITTWASGHQDTGIAQIMGTYSIP
jgi:hypothetical protein